MQMHVPLLEKCAAGIKHGKSLDRHPGGSVCVDQLTYLLTFATATLLVQAIAHFSSRLMSSSMALLAAAPTA